MRLAGRSPLPDQIRAVAAQAFEVLVTTPLLSALLDLLEASHFAAPDDLPQLASRAGGFIGADATTIYLVDYDQIMLVPFLDSDGPNVEQVPVDGTIAGRSFIDVAQHTATGSAATVWSPLLDGTERLGVVQMQFPQSHQLDEELLASCRHVTGLLAELVMTRTRYGDSMERLRRRTGLTVPAEMQWRLLPPLTFVTDVVGIAGVLLPAEEIAGDAFDYSLNGDIAHVAIFDAMGHGLEATLLAAVSISTLRNARRSNLDLVSTVEAIDATISGQFGPDKFVTGIVAELDIGTGHWRYVNFGHPPTLLIRNGHVVKSLSGAVLPPLGLGFVGDSAVVDSERLERGDRLLLYSDGVIEARDAAGDLFGTERLVAFVTREAADGRPVTETLRRLNRAILAHQKDKLQDDATTVVVEWMTGQAAAISPG